MTSGLKYLMKHENEEAGVDECQSNHYSLVPLVGSEHLIKIWVKVVERAHEDCYANDASPSVSSLQN